MKEIWKDIKNYEGIYQVSNLGRIKSLGRKDAIGRIKKEKIMKENCNNYVQIKLCYEQKQSNKYVHRLVAEEFLNNELNCKEVNHINGIKTDNRVENLEWVTPRENQLHSYKLNLRKPTTKKVRQYNLKNKLIKEWNSLTEAARYYDISYTNISSCCNGKRKTSAGFRWEFV